MKTGLKRRVCFLRYLLIFNCLNYLPQTNSSFVSEGGSDLQNSEVQDFKNNSDNNNTKVKGLVRLLCCDREGDKCGLSTLNQDKVWTAHANLMSTNVSTPFLLRSSKLPCQKTLFPLTLPLNSSSPKIHLYPSGYLRHEKEFYAPDEFCLRSLSSIEVHLLICPPSCSLSRASSASTTRACIPKCCPMDKVYSIGITNSKGCRPSPKQFNPPLYYDFYTKVKGQSHPLPHFFLWSIKNFAHNCVNNKTTLIPYSQTVASNISHHLQRTRALNLSLNSIHFHFRTDGSFLYKNVVEKKCKIESDPSRVLCVDGLMDYGLDLDLEQGQGQSFSNNEEEYGVFLCNMWKLEELQVRESQLAYGVLMLIVAIFPLVTMLVYVALWKRQNVHGWTIAATSGSLTALYLVQGSALVVGTVIGRDEGGRMCTGVAVVAHFFLLASFAWLTVMCGDLWWTFRSLTPANRRSKGMKRYQKYSMVGWGIPTVIVGTGVFLDYIYRFEDGCTPHLLPGYGVVSCWLIPSSQGAYVFYPVAVLLSLNFMFFLVTCFKLLRYRKNTQFVTRRETDHWQGFVRFTKLFLVMGVSWIFEIVSWLVDGQTLKWYWIVFDVINILRAVGIFVVYVCKQDILLMLEDTYPTLKNVFRRFKRRCSDDLSEQTGSTAVSPSPAPMRQFSIFRNSR